MIKTYDDFDWDTYTETNYEKQLIASTTQHTIIVKPSQDENFNESFANLHPNWKEIYYQIHKLGVKSVFECGCGCAMHLINIATLYPQVSIAGCDYAQSQIDLGYKYLNLEDYNFNNKIVQKDMTKNSGIEELGTHEFVYTQAVTMHLEHHKAVSFLKNMGRLSSKYIFLIENYNSHDYDSLLSEALPDFERLKNDNQYVPNSAYLLRKKK
tara:strand:- start:620 stop:1252 length:633 start_codon:yes stop_codon:yes gene_type:complete